jgi:hypothetical protein
MQALFAQNRNYLTRHFALQSACKHQQGIMTTAPPPRRRSPLYSAKYLQTTLFGAGVLKYSSIGGLCVFLGGTPTPFHKHYKRVINRVLVSQFYPAIARVVLSIVVIINI